MTRRMLASAFAMTMILTAGSAMAAPVRENPIQSASAGFKAGVKAGVDVYKEHRAESKAAGPGFLQRKMMQAGSSMKAAAAKLGSDMKQAQSNLGKGMKQAETNIHNAAMATKMNIGKGMKQAETNMHNTAMAAKTNLAKTGLAMKSGTAMAMKNTKAFGEGLVLDAQTMVRMAKNARNAFVSTKAQLSAAKATSTASSSPDVIALPPAKSTALALRPAVAERVIAEPMQPSVAMKTVTFSGLNKRNNHSHDKKAIAAKQRKDAEKASRQAKAAEKLANKQKA